MILSNPDLQLLREKSTTLTIIQRLDWVHILFDIRKNSVEQWRDWIEGIAPAKGGVKS